MPVTSTRTGVGLIGAGRMGRVHADILAHEVSEARLVAVADVDAAAARAVAGPLGARVYQDYGELLRDDMVQAVLVATPTRSHMRIVSDAVSAGVGIFCEKPLALSVEETRAMAFLANEAGVHLQVGLYRRFDPDYRRARQRIRSGAIGRPQFVRSVQYDTFVPPLDFCDPSVSGGIAVDMGIHEFDIAAWLLDDEIEAVHSFGAINGPAELSAIGDVDTFIATMRFRSGALGSVELIRDVGYAEEVRTEVIGTRGSVIIGGYPSSQSAQTEQGSLRFDLAPSVFSRFRPALVEQLRSFGRAMLDDTPVEVRGEDSIQGLAAGVAARESLRSGRSTDMPRV